MEKTLTIFELCGITGASGILSGLIMSHIDHFLLKSRELKAKQWEIKKDACVQALSIIDTYFSHLDWRQPNGVALQNPQKQTAFIDDAREAQNKLIVACEDTRIINKFNQILFNNNANPKLTEELNELRNLVRNELGFGKGITLDKDKAWYSNIIGTTEKDQSQLFTKK